MTWKAFRTLTTQAAEGTTPPVQATFVGLNVPGDDSVMAYITDAGRIQNVEVGFESITFSGSPTSVVLTIWRWSEGKADKVASITINSTDLPNVVPVVVNFLGEGIWALVESFSGGTSPNISGTLRVRPVRV